MRTKIVRRQKRKKSIRTKIRGTKEMPRLSIFRSNKYLFVQLIDDENMKTLMGMSDKNIKSKGNKNEKAENLAKEFAGKLKESKIKGLVFDRNGYKYHGRVKSFANSLRKEGVNF